MQCPSGAVTVVTVCTLWTFAASNLLVVKLLKHGAISVVWQCFCVTIVVVGQVVP